MQERNTRESRIVLVVEDDPLLRMHAVDLVEEAGFEPVEAADATEALEILEARPDIRIVFSDIDMPRGMDGMRLAAMIRDRWPPIKVILTSGYFRRSDIRLPTESVFIPKPYVDKDVVAAMRRFARRV
ncbi:MAG: response regulator [Fulvimarina manganoxydans]|uniref:response regulator n=1 Tax=Fulvimarina manganoxydans TaxID=937218 RepID=UPI0023544DF6|nr:response regulator [Fulvimarina manganoxydans]MCK5931015.1 response regulator [Fulvimarina manganoxydans]